MTVSSSRFGLGFLAGFLAALFIAAVVAIVVLRKTDQYGLGHWKLNVKTPLRSMWMNVGYWRDSEGNLIDDFPEASAALLREVLTTAGLPKEENKPVAILDLGFGCGDQTWDLIKTLSEKAWGWQYVGLSLNPDQVRFAQRRIYRDMPLHNMDPTITTQHFKLICANAARPETWSRQTTLSVLSLADPEIEERWLLALDCIYHFKPSRKPIYTYASSKLNANLMVFDLILADKVSTKDLFYARAISVIMGCPVKTFMTESEYRNQLVECGYHGDAIFRDVTKDVFAPLVAFIDRQDATLAEHGISLGGFKLAQRLFDWFHRSGVVKAVIVVARVKKGD